MSLLAGSRLGPYEVLGLIGAGGMGEVYKARDTRLDRTVAIKILPAELSADPDRRARFEREARAIAALSHPHICTLHDIGEAIPSGPACPERTLDQASRGESRVPNPGPVHYLVMEHLAGESLAERLLRGALPMEQALTVAAQMADALAAAHRQGIIHRDLKPANVMLTKTGTKLLDFGLAKLKAHGEAPAAAPGAEAPGLHRESAPTRSAPLTGAGVILGTLPYMAPEQLEGKEADARTDLWALGAIMYEMVAGTRAFEGTSAVTLMANIMKAEPAPLATFHALTPPGFDRLVRRCLAKDPDERRQSAADVAEELRGISQDTAAPAVRRAPAPHRRHWMVGVAALLVVIAAGVVALGVRSHWWQPRPLPVRSDIAMAEGTQFIGAFSGLAMAPDGRGLVYRAADHAGSRLYWQRLDGSPPRAIPGTDGSSTPFFSPDGNYLGFALRSKLVKLPLPSGSPGDGGAVEPLADIGWIRGAAWGEGGTILYSPFAFGGLWRVPAGGGDAREVTKPDPARNEISHRWPAFLPGGRAALFTIQDASGRQDRNAIAVLSLDTGTWTRIIERGTCARYLPTGHVVYALGGTLLAIRFDLQTLAATGPPTPVAHGVHSENRAGGDAWFDVSQSGSLVFAGGSDVPVRDSLVWLDRNGQIEPLPGDLRDYDVSLDLSPDGQRLATNDDTQVFVNLWLYHFPDRRWQQLRTDADELRPVWSPTGDRLAFSSNRDGAFNVYVTRPDEDGRAERLTHSRNWQFPYSWSPDGRFLAYEEQDGESSWNIWILPLDGDRKPWLWGPQRQGASLPAFSPDGRWLAYQSVETGTWEVYVRPFPGPGPRQRVSGPDGGFGPVWSRNGRELLYLSGGNKDNRILAVDVSTGPPLRFTNPHVAFALPFAPGSANQYHRRVFALAPDGDRILLVRPDAAPAAEIHSLTLVRNWAEDVKAKVAAAGAK